MSTDTKKKEEKKEEFWVTIPVKFTKQRVWDLLCCGMEGGYGSFTIINYEPENIRDNPACEYPHIDTPFLGGTILMKDKYGDSEKVYRLDKEALARGLTVMGEKYPSHMANFMEENDDAITGDVFIQCALLGDIIYG